MTLLVTGACVLSVACVGFTSAWYMGFFTAKGRFGPRDPCRILPPPAKLAGLVRGGAREPGDSKPKTLLGLGGDASAECKWSSVPAGQDEPFRTIRIHVETKTREGRSSAETRAERGLESWRKARLQSRGPVIAVRGVGEKAYGNTDQMDVRIVFSRIVVYDLHVKFRMSNALVDVSARTHRHPGFHEERLVEGLAREVAKELDQTA
ncbi:hypothetical protein J4573_45425 [Actinomadura barringtoniae]|uniref:Uncharacterized protein n=1 Tax=Actinomadura barringtoniae TaxID=1427535 RepID=A0A939PTB3_9ACTN|nr:hypothetical protein [Actinomadura barringtoniae]MBO2454396.1 hypothetical protein [Actinomadura barringtoniae]